MKTIPERTCLGCNSKKNKKDLLRIVKPKEEDVQIDLTGKANGRGAYICKSIECLERCKKSKRLENKLGTVISEEIYDKIKGVIVDAVK